MHLLLSSQILNSNFRLYCYYESCEWNPRIRWHQLWEMVPETWDCTGDGQYRFGHHKPAPIEPEKPVSGENEEATAWALREKIYDTTWTRFNIDRAHWNNSNRKCLMIIKGSISDANQNVNHRWPHRLRILSQSEESVYWFLQDFCCHSYWVAYD